MLKRTLHIEVTASRILNVAEHKGPQILDGIEAAVSGWQQDQSAAGDLKAGELKVEQARCKGSVMNWRVAGANGIIAVRVQQVGRDQMWCLGQGGLIYQLKCPVWLPSRFPRTTNPGG